MAGAWQLTMIIFATRMSLNSEQTLSLFHSKQLLSEPGKCACSDSRITFPRLRGGSSSSSDIHERPNKKARKFSAVNLGDSGSDPEQTQQSERSTKMEEVYDEAGSIYDDVEEISDDTLRWLGEPDLNFPSPDVLPLYRA